VGTTTINFSTDDPFNAAHRAAWHLNALEAYDLVCTPRRANIDELSELGCRRVAYIQFAYDPELFFPQTAHDGAAGLADYANAVVFVGGADPDRVTFFSDFIGSGVPVVLHGGYWARYGRLRAWNRGLADPIRLRSLTAAAGVNICLVRRANRDDHVMRSFEIPAVGGFMIAEDTAGHRDIFGEEGQCVLYFKTAQEAAEKSYWALNHPEERRRMAIAAHELVIHGGHTYQDRLLAMLSAIPS
jgi:spore maturation protein CgeB